MSVYLFAAATLSFMVFQFVQYYDARVQSKNLVIWEDRVVWCLIVAIAIFVGFVVALLSQDYGVSASGVENIYPFPLDFEMKTTVEWVRAVVLGYGAMPILKKGGISGMKKISVDNTPLGSRRIGLLGYLKVWWSVQ